MIYTAVVLAIIAALIDHFFGIPRPWNKLVYAGIVILLIIGVVLLFLPMGLPRDFLPRFQ